jgi:hypothetical protein
MYINTIIIEQCVRCRIGLGWLEQSHGLVDENRFEKLLSIINVILVPGYTEPQQGQCQHDRIAYHGHQLLIAKEQEIRIQLLLDAVT